MTTKQTEHSTDTDSAGRPIEHGFKGDADYRPLDETVDPDIALALARPPAEGWRPSEGDQLAGTVVDVDEGENEYGVYPLLTIEKRSGECVNLHCFHTVLKNTVSRAIAKGKLVEGCRIGVTYDGKKAGGGAKGGDLDMYRVVILPASGSESTSAGNIGGVR